MRDLHCHVLPGVDDGAPDLEHSLAMLQAAQGVGITSVTCTPHCRDPYFDFDAMWGSFYTLRDAAAQRGIALPLRMGFEVNHRKLMDLGMDWARSLHVDGSDEFLLELSVNASPSRFGDYERTIFELQGMGYQVIIAHPERYRAIQRDMGLAEELVHMGCKLQASTDFIAGGRLGAEKGPARRMLKAGLYSYLASDAHRVGHYALFERAWKRYARFLRA